MHVLPQLRKLERQYERELVIIGIHSGKFTAERVTENIRQAVLRLDVKHPVVNDRYFRIWRSYNIDAWPTLVLIDPKGYEIGAYPGEITAEAFQPIIDQFIDEFDAKGEIDRTPLAFLVETMRETDQPLAFPAKVLATEDQRVFIADTRHNRILVVALQGDGTEGRVQEIIGRGKAGFDDGDFQAATFHRPQGLALQDNILYIADTENHAIRAIDLHTKQVKAAAGSGQESWQINTTGRGTQVGLNSPWDIVSVDGALYIAMAGLHQLWRLIPGTGDIHPYAGSRFEELTDGPLHRAGLAQPSGITADGQRLYFADSESSAIRQADLDPSGEVETIVGKGLFDFGDKDGIGGHARLQHPQGIVWYQGLLYVADTYNNKIKTVDPSSHMSTTLVGSPEPGFRDGDQPLFYEPGGISAANGKLFVADTNNHRVRVVDMNTRSVTTLKLKGI